MRNLGWDSGAFDPKKTYNIAVQTQSSVSKDTAQSLVEQFHTMKRANYNSLAKYYESCKWLLNRLKDADLGIPKKVAWLSIVNGIKDTDPIWYNFKMYDYKKGDVKLNELFKELSTIAKSESSPTMLAAITNPPATTPVIEYSCPKCWLCKNKSDFKGKHCRKCLRHHNLNEVCPPPPSSNNRGGRGGRRGGRGGGRRGGNNNNNGGSNSNNSGSNSNSNNGSNGNNGGGQGS